jgi:anti-sigma regulatory factor (Ser/Thr protein kinase)
MTDERRFPNRPESVTQARRFARSLVDDDPVEIADAVELMVSELATNAVRHAATHFTVRVDRDGLNLRVAVTDEGPGHPELRSPAPVEPTGRGLQIVRALSDDWGVTALDNGQGKTVWFTLDTEPRQVVAES